MDEIKLRYDEPPVRLIALQIYQDSFMKKKWRHVAGALIESSKHGRARLEIYNNEEGLNAIKPSSVIILDDCLSIRVVDLQDESTRHLKLHLRSGNIVSLKADNVFALRTQLSRLAFPSQYVTLNRPFSLDSPTTPPDMIPAECSLSSPALLLQTVGGIQEGSYDIAFNDDKLELRKDNNIAASFDYEHIFWIASGDYCFGFETNQTYLLYEFKCTQPQQIIDNYRKKCKFRAHFHPTSRSTINHYLRFYYPDILRSGESTLSSESKNFPCSSSIAKSQPMLPESSQGSSEYEEISAQQIRNVRFAPVVTTEINPKGTNKIMGFFKNISPFNKTPKERSAFEQRANYEFRHAAAKKKGRTQPEKLATIIRYNPDSRISRVGTSQVEPQQSLSSEPEVNTETSGSGVERPYSPIPLAIASSPLDTSIISLVSHLAPSTRVSLASATPTADAARVSRVEILQSTYID